MEGNCPYPTDPVEVVLSDPHTCQPEPKARRVRFTAGALRRAAKAVAALAEGSTEVDALVARLWEGLLDKEGIPSAEALYERIDARAIPHLVMKLGEAITEATPQKDPTDPAASPTAN